MLELAFGTVGEDANVWNRNRKRKYTVVCCFNLVSKL
jgi:hypothetical protein